MNMIRVAAFLLALPALILGGHGLYAYFYPLETLVSLFTESQAKLFFAIEVPAELTDVVTWMSLKGLQSWFVPAVITLLGLLLIGYAFKDKND